MSFDGVAVSDLLNALVTHAMTLGYFESVNTHEPKSAPGNGLQCSIWVDTIDPVPSSGLASTSGRLVFHVRIYSNMLQEPQDDIDPNILTAVCALLEDYSGQFELGGAGGTRNVDLLGTHGQALSAQAGYLQMDNRIYRVMVIAMPVLINDLWDQVA